MQRHHEQFEGDDLAPHDETEVQVVAEGAVGMIVKSEVEAQLDAAHKYRRSIQRFLQEATTLATLNQEIAESCLYSVPRSGKMIDGPSVRLAEIVASAYGNMQVGARVLDAEDREILAQGVAWDMEKNLRVTIEIRRRITNSRGVRYNDDMINVTGRAAASIALRDAIFRVVPRAYVQQIYGQARRVAVGDAKTLVNRRADVLERLQKLGVAQDRVLQKLDVKGVEDIGLEQLAVLIGLGSAIKNGDQQLDDVFPAVAIAAPAPAAPAQDGKRISLKKGKKPEAPTVNEDGEVQQPPESAAPAPAAEREPGSDDR